MHLGYKQIVIIQDEVSQTNILTIQKIDCQYFKNKLSKLFPWNILEDKYKGTLSVMNIIAGMIILQC